MASLSVPCPKCSSSPTLFSSPNRPPPPSILSFPYGSLPSSTFPPFLRQTRREASNGKLHAQLGEVVVKESSNSIPKLSVSDKEAPAPAVIPDEASINAFISQVSDLVKLVDSKDIVELELKQQGCELLIRKKDAIPLPPASVAAPQLSYYAAPPPPQAQPTTAAPTPSSPTRALPAPAAPAKPSASSHPPLKCPMAGTFYRCPGPGEPPFVKVGDKVQKGQVICIIEAMKLMNEIEADQSGTVAEILVEDGKPVSVDMPLFVIAP